MTFRGRSALKVFEQRTGGLSFDELTDYDNLNQLTYFVKSRWFDATGKEDADFADRVSREYWRILENAKSQRDMHTDLVSAKRKRDRVESKIL